MSGPARAVAAAMIATSLGCGAGAVATSAGDAATSQPPMDLGTPIVDATRDVVPEPRGCPMTDEDVPGTDVPTGDAPHVTDLAVSAQLFQCALMSDGTVRCRGLNAEGRLGNGRTNEVNVPPTTVPDLHDVEQVVTHSNGATCSRHRDGSVRCWGSNRYHLLGTGHAGDQDCLGVPCRMSPTPVPGLTEVVSLVSGHSSICAIRRDGGVWCWGSDDRLLPSGGSANPVDTGLSDVAAMWPRAFGWVWRTRSGRYGADLPFGVDIPAEAEFADGGSSGHLCYRLPDGSARCLGLNAEGQLGNGQASIDISRAGEPSDPGLCGVRSIATGVYNTCAVLLDRTVWCWGDGSRGALGCPTSAPCEGSTGSATRPRRVWGLDGVDRVFVGVWGACALRVDRSVWCWGALVQGRETTLTRVAW